MDTLSADSRVTCARAIALLDLSAVLHMPNPKPERYGPPPAEASQGHPWRRTLSTESAWMASAAKIAELSAGGHGTMCVAVKRGRDAHI